MFRIVEAFGEFDEHRIASALGTSVTSGAVTVGLLAGGNVLTLAMDSGLRLGGSDAKCKRIPLVCVSKVLTGTVALVAANEQRLDFDAAIADLGEPCLAPFADVTIRQLLSHSHGVDASHLPSLPLTDDGWIDLPTLSKSLNGVPRLFEAGTLYSYGRAGPWLLAGILERVYSLRFADLVMFKALLPAGVEHSCGTEPPLCPATGANLALTVSELLQFMGWFMRAKSLCKHAELAKETAAPPGWSLDSGASAGWKHYESGWLGHNTADNSLVVRAHPDGVAIVVAARGTSASRTMIRIFGRLLPEYHYIMQIPRLLPSHVTPQAASLCTGTYANSTTSVEVTCSDAIGLRAAIAFQEPAASTLTRYVSSLQPGTSSAFLADPLVARLFRWIQFVPRGAANPTHLWNGTQLLYRI